MKNILFIMADQLTPFLTGAYGHPVVQTPSLDRLVEQGVRFDAAYSPCPVCAPARASLLTGKYVSNIGAWDNGAPFASEEPTLLHYLSLAGYDTVLSGKMHFVGPDQQHGFSRRLTTDISPTGFDWTPKRGQAVTSARSHAQHYVGEAIQVGRWSDYLSFDEETHFRALEYIRARGAERFSSGQGNPAKPFFLCVSYHHPHEPFLPPTKYWDLYEGADIAIPEFPPDLEESYSIFDRWLNINHGVAREANLRHPDSLRRLRRAYYALVSYIDQKVGELTAALEENGLAGNTVIVFTSDHGDMLVEKGMVQKRTFYEWSSRIPLIMCFPGGDHAGMRRPEPVSLVDLLPTLLDIAGVDPADRLAADGRSLVDLLAAEHAGDRFVFSEYHSQGAHAPCFMVRRGRFKFIYIHGYEKHLFDLEADPGEWRNLARDSDYSAVMKELESLILSHFDPEQIEKRVTDSIKKRGFVHRAMRHSRISWEMEPRFDAGLSMLKRYFHDGK